MLITRTHPDLQLPLLRARNELLEIDTQELRFNAQETESFLQASTQAQIPSPAIVSLFQKTDGWAAGLQLAALSLQNKNADQIQEFVQNFSGSHRYVSDYLIKEVFESQPKSAQAFLLKTCFLKSLTASLCDETAGIENSAAFLNFLNGTIYFLCGSTRAAVSPGIATTLSSQSRSSFLPGSGWIRKPFNYCLKGLVDGMNIMASLKMPLRPR